MSGKKTNLSLFPLWQISPDNSLSRKLFFLEKISVLNAKKDIVLVYAFVFLITLQVDDKLDNILLFRTKELTSLFHFKTQTKYEKNYTNPSFFGFIRFSNVG